MQEQMTPSKQRLYHFLKNAEMDKEYKFIFRGTHEQARYFIHQMRVDLSNFRRKVIDRGKRVKPFKLLVLACIDLKTNPETTEIVLLKATNIYAKTNPVVKDILDELIDSDFIASSVGEIKQ